MTRNALAALAVGNQCKLSQMDNNRHTKEVHD
jgi:hypothetical protein